MNGRCPDLERGWCQSMFVIRKLLSPLRVLTYGFGGSQQRYRVQRARNCRAMPFHRIASEVRIEH